MIYGEVNSGGAAAAVAGGGPIVGGWVIAGDGAIADNLV